MKNPIIRSKAVADIAIFNMIVLASGLSVTVLGTWNISDIVLVVSLVLVGSIGSAGICWRSVTKYARAMAEIERITSEIAAGKISSRISTLGIDEDLAKSCWKLNDMLDQLETSLHEYQAAANHLGERSPNLEGLKGTFRDLAQSGHTAKKLEISSKQAYELLST
jgi:methyl-accepting chemotaxis protein